MDCFENYIHTVESIKDCQGMPVDKLIKRSVAILMSLGFDTTGSCQGHVYWGTNFPWIEIATNSQSINYISKQRLNKCLEIYKQSNITNIFLDNLNFDDAFRIQTRKFEYKHNEPDENDDQIRFKSQLENDQKEIIDFCEWMLKNKNVLPSWQIENMN